MTVMIGVARGVPDEIYAAKAAEMLASVRLDSAVPLPGSSSPRSCSKTCAASTPRSRSRGSGWRRWSGRRGPRPPRSSAWARWSPPPPSGSRGTSPASPAGTTSPPSTGRPLSTSPPEARCPPALPTRQPAAQPRHPHGGGDPDPASPQRGARLRPQAGRGQGPQRGSPVPQAADQRRALRLHDRRRATQRPNDRARPGRANGERLCLQRGRLTPRDAGSSDEPLPGPRPGYDRHAQAAPLAIST